MDQEQVSSSEPANEQAVERLLRTAGPRAEVPQARRERVRLVARSAWREGAAAHRRRRFGLWSVSAGVAAAALVALALVPGFLRGTGSGAVVAKVRHAPAGLAAAEGSSSRPLKKGAEIRAGSVLETSPAARAALELSGGGSLRLDVGTRLRAESAEVFTLERGAVYLDSEGRPGGFEIRTARGQVRDIGTQFEVRLDGGLFVRVREGKIELSRDGTAREAVAGVELSVSEQGQISQRAIPVFGPLWNWAAAAAPAFAVEGRSAREFLEWVCREEGWTLRYQETATEAAATSAILHGSAEGLAPLEALTAVLPVSGLQHTVKDGILTVSPAR